ncbi:hypothetical protein AK812_SmicGene43252 [Symbiodinium microadriaticum]|uniref:Uncharacterized protein n=1 Tax=Symbiodinium microadriaticum TaxID=2951 RepID=A0A1Q9C1H5_SYMMI|nr:hypothetical protein AK812_SmicGene43252 [Symbiodinium microadriaticum]
MTETAPHGLIVQILSLSKGTVRRSPPAFSMQLEQLGVERLQPVPHLSAGSHETSQSWTYSLWSHAEAAEA